VTARRRRSRPSQAAVARPLLWPAAWTWPSAFRHRRHRYGWLYRGRKAVRKAVRGPVPRSAGRRRPRDGASTCPSAHGRPRMPGCGRALAGHPAGGISMRPIWTRPGSRCPEELGHQRPGPGLERPEPRPRTPRTPAPNTQGRPPNAQNPGPEHPGPASERPEPRPPAATQAPQRRQPLLRAVESRT
jgi:hypothetical protein